MDDCANEKCKHEKYSHQDPLEEGKEPFSGRCLIKEDGCRCKKFRAVNEKGAKK